MRASKNLQAPGSKKQKELQAQLLRMRETADKESERESGGAEVQQPSSEVLLALKGKNAAESARRSGAGAGA